jgi:hypothetical protein
MLSRNGCAYLRVNPEPIFHELLVKRDIIARGKEKNGEERLASLTENTKSLWQSYLLAPSSP